MNDMFQPLFHRCVLVFFDNILVYKRHICSHEKNLCKVMTMLLQHRLYAKESKYNFGGSTVEYFGHVISVAEVATDPMKFTTVREWLISTSVKHLHRFSGFT